MAKKLTQKQLSKTRTELRNEVSGLNITLEYSIKLLEDYESDLKEDLKELRKTIKSAKLKHKKISLQLSEHDKALIDRLNKTA